MCSHGAPYRHTWQGFIMHTTCALSHQAQLTSFLSSPTHLTRAFSLQTGRNALTPTLRKNHFGTANKTYQPAHPLNAFININRTTFGKIKTIKRPKRIFNRVQREKRLKEQKKLERSSKIGRILLFFLLSIPLVPPSINFLLPLSENKKILRKEKQAELLTAQLNQHGCDDEQFFIELKELPIKQKVEALKQRLNNCEGNKED